MAHLKLINNGELVKASVKKYAETVVFVPFFFGKKQNMKRHAEFLAEIGFDSVIFNLSYKLKKIYKQLPEALPNGWGLKHIWSKEITDVLDAIPGNKILYGFSNPSSAALEAIRLRGTKDITGFICDGGPFFELLRCNWNFYTHYYPLKNPIKKIGFNAFARGIWTISHEKQIKRDLASLPKGFPILSIRGWQDPLVPASCIEKAFHGHSHIDLEVLNLPEGKHLDGLKSFPETYKARVTEFLKSIANRTS